MLLHITMDMRERTAPS